MRGSVIVSLVLAVGCFEDSSPNPQSSTGAQATSTGEAETEATTASSSSSSSTSTGPTSDSSGTSSTSGTTSTGPTTDDSSSGDPPPLGCDCPRNYLFCDSFEEADGQDVLAGWIAPGEGNLPPVQTSLVSRCEDAAMFASVESGDPSSVLTRAETIGSTVGIRATGFVNTDACDADAADEIRLAQLRLDAEDAMGMRAFQLSAMLFMTDTDTFELATHVNPDAVEFAEMPVLVRDRGWIRFELEIDLSANGGESPQATLRIAGFEVGPVPMSAPMAAPNLAQLVLGIQPLNGAFASDCDVTFDLASLESPLESRP